MPPPPSSLRKRPDRPLLSISVSHSQSSGSHVFFFSYFSRASIPPNHRRPKTFFFSLAPPPLRRAPCAARSPLTTHARARNVECDYTLLFSLYVVHIWSLSLHTRAVSTLFIPMTSLSLSLSHGNPQPPPRAPHWVPPPKQQQQQLGVLRAALL